MKVLWLKSPKTFVEGVEEYLKCLDTTKSAQLTIYVNQAIANNGFAFTTEADKAGHAFINITQGNITRVYGLYPQGNASPYNPSGSFSFGNNQNDGFDISISFNINSASLNNIINDANNYLSNYNLNSNNCTDYVIQTVALRWANLPDPQSTWLNGGGSNPGAFGQEILIFLLAWPETQAEAMLILIMEIVIKNEKNKYFIYRNIYNIFCFVSNNK